MATAERGSESSSGLSLAIRLRSGSSEAWRDLVELYGPLVDNWCAAAGLNAAARADVAQNVFLSVYRGIDNFDPNHPRATFRGWLWKITRNAVLAWLRSAGPEPTGGSSAQAKLAAVADPWDGSSQDIPPAGVEETAALFRRAVEQIRAVVEPQTFAAFWETAVLGRGAPEVAATLGITPVAVRQAKSRVLRRLRQQLGDC